LKQNIKRKKDGISILIVMVDKNKLIAFANTSKPKTEAEKIRHVIAQKSKICRKCNATYPHFYYRCIVCGSGDEENLEIIDMTYLLVRLKEIERIESASVRSF
jgi:ribosomal protein L40E